MEKKEKRPPPPPLTVRTSMIVLAWRLILLELVIVLIFLLLGFPAYFMNVSQNLYSTLFSIYTLTYLALAIIKIFFVLVIVLTYINDYYEIREGEVLQKSGIFTMREKIFSLHGVQSITVSQGIFGKLLNYGTIALINPVLNESFNLYLIRNPQKYLLLIKQQTPAMEDIKRSTTIIRGIQESAESA